MFGWDLPEDTIFYDEIFYTETITRLATEMLKNNEEKIIKAALVGNPDVLDENISEYYIADSVIYDDESYFVDKMYDFAFNKASYLAKPDFSAYLDLNTLAKKVRPKKQGFKYAATLAARRADVQSAHKLPNNSKKSIALTATLFLLLDIKANTNNKISFKLDPILCKSPIKFLHCLQLHFYTSQKISSCFSLMFHYHHYLYLHR